MPPTPRSHKLAGPGAYHVSKRLANYSLRYNMASMIGDMFLKPIYVVKESDEFTTWDKLHVVAGSDGPRGHRDAATEIRAGQGSDSYRLRFYSHSGFVSERERANADEWVDPDEKAIRDVKEYLLVQKEIRAAALAFTAANYGSNNKVTLSGSDQWSDPTSDPISVLETAFARVNLTSRKPDTEMTMTMGDDVWRKVRQHPTIVSRYQYTEGGRVTRKQWADFWDIKPENFHVGISSYNSANEGQADVETRIWGNHCFVGYIDPNPQMDTVTFAASFQRRENEEAWTVEHGNPKGEEHILEMGYDQKIIASDVGYLIIDAAA